MSPEAKSVKASSFLSALRSGQVGQQAAGGGADAAAIAPLKRRIEELEKKLAEVSKLTAPPEDGEPPRAPSEVMMYIQTRMELLERKLQEAQGEALRANLLLSEREAAQRKAQKEVEDLFRSIKEQTHAAQWDARLREQFSESQRKIQDLEARLREAELRAIPAEEVLRALQDFDATETLRKRLEERVARIQSVMPDIAVRGGPPGEGGGPPAPPSAAVAAAARPEPYTPPHPGSDAGTTLMLMTRIADLERALEETKAERDAERARRADWEKNVVENMAAANEDWKKRGGVEITVEAALETMTLAMREREDVEKELADAIDLSQQQPPGSPADPVLRARISAAQERLARIQQSLQQQMALVQAWISQNK